MGGDHGTAVGAVELIQCLDAPDPAAVSAAGQDEGLAALGAPGRVGGAAAATAQETGHKGSTAQNDHGLAQESPDRTRRNPARMAARETAVRRFQRRWVIRPPFPNERHA